MRAREVTCSLSAMSGGGEGRGRGRGKERGEGERKRGREGRGGEGWADVRSAGGKVSSRLGDDFFRIEEYI